MLHLAITILLYCSANCFHWSPDKARLYDLEFPSPNFFEEAKVWQTTNMLTGTEKTTECLDPFDLVLGGPRGSLQMSANINGWYRTYTNLPKHDFVEVEMKIYPLDNWKGETIAVNVGGQIQGSVGVFRQENNVEANVDICGSPTRDIPPFKVHVTARHSSMKNLQIFAFILSNRTSLEHSIGVRDIVITFFNSTLSLPESSICEVAPYLIEEGRGCSCEALTTATETSGSCEGCDPTCASCNKPGLHGCTACHPGSYLSQDGLCLECSNRCSTCSGEPDFCTTCIKDDAFPTLAGNCLCPTGLIEVGGDCVVPCQNPTEYTYWFGGCSATCEKPLIGQEEPFKACYSPCLNLDYLNQDGTCSPNCLEPFNKLFRESKNFCTSPCLVNEFLYWDHTCKSHCEPPYKLELNKVCNYPCHETDFFDKIRGVCIPDNCPNLYVNTVDAYGKKFCDFPCANKDDYLFWDGNCHSTCESPYIKEANQKCN